MKPSFAWSVVSAIVFLMITDWIWLLVSHVFFQPWKWDDDPQWRAYVEIGLIAPIRSCRPRNLGSSPALGSQTPLNQDVHALSKNLPRKPGSLILMAYKPYFIKCSSHEIFDRRFGRRLEQLFHLGCWVDVFHRCSTSWFISIIINKYIHKYAHKYLYTLYMPICLS